MKSIDLGGCWTLYSTDDECLAGDIPEVYARNYENLAEVYYVYESGGGFLVSTSSSPGNVAVIPRRIFEEVTKLADSLGELEK